LREIAKDLEEIATIEQAPLLEGKNMSMLVTPAKSGSKKKPSSDEKPAKLAPVAEKIEAVKTD
jgi:hypothetical protein